MSSSLSYFSLPCATTVILQFVLYHPCPLATDPLHLLSSAILSFCSLSSGPIASWTLPILCAPSNLSSGTTVLLQPVLCHSSPFAVYSLPLLSHCSQYFAIPVLFHSCPVAACLMPLLLYCRFPSTTTVLVETVLCHYCPIVTCPLTLLFFFSLCPATPVLLQLVLNSPVLFKVFPLPLLSCRSLSSSAPVLLKPVL